MIPLDTTNLKKDSSDNFFGTATVDSRTEIKTTTVVM